MAEESAKGPSRVLETIELVGPAGRIVVNYRDREQYLAKGYRPADEPQTDEPDEEDLEVDGEDLDED